MSRAWSGADADRGVGLVDDGPAAGRRTRTQALASRPPVQRSISNGDDGAATAALAQLIDDAVRPDLAIVQRSGGDGGDGADGGEAAAIDRAARHGTSGAAGALPHLDTIQQAFGRHDVRDVAAHQDGAAREGAAAMHAEAFATGDRIAFASAPSLHTAAHEAAHVVQQRAGVVQASGTAGDVFERHADRVADQVVAGGAAESVLDEIVGGGTPRPAPSAGAPVQRTITVGAETLPTTWLALNKTDKTGASKYAPATLQAARDAMTALRAAIGADPVEDKIIKVWNQAASAKGGTYALPAGQDEMVTAMEAAYRRAVKARADFQKRAGGAERVAAGVMSAAPSLEIKTLGRNKGLVDKHLEPFDWDPNTTAEDRHQTHLATVALHSVGAAEAIETQATMRRDMTGMMMSSNKNAANRKLAGGLSSRDDLLRQAVDLSSKQGIKTATTAQARANRVLRHSIQSYKNMPNFLTPDATVHVPASVPTALDGKHAELREVDDPTYNQHDFYLPSGTKIPCMGCRCGFCQRGLPAGDRMGPAWLADVALTSQVGPELEQGKRMKSLSPEEAQVASERWRQQFLALPSSVKMGHCRTSDGTYTTDVAPDSPLDTIPEPELELIMHEMTEAHGDVRPRSPEPPSPQREHRRDQARSSLRTALSSPRPAYPQATGAINRRLKRTVDEMTSVRAAAPALSRTDLLAVVRAACVDNDLSFKDIDFLDDADLLALLHQILDAVEAPTSKVQKGTLTSSPHGITGATVPGSTPSLAPAITTSSGFPPPFDPGLPPMSSINPFSVASTSSPAYHPPHQSAPSPLSSFSGPFPFSPPPGSTTAAPSGSFAMPGSTPSLSPFSSPTSNPHSMLSMLSMPPSPSFATSSHDPFATFTHDPFATHSAPSPMGSMPPLSPSFATSSHDPFATFTHDPFATHSAPSIWSHGPPSPGASSLWPPSPNQHLPPSPHPHPYPPTHTSALDDPPLLSSSQHLSSPDHPGSLSWLDDELLGEDYGGDLPVSTFGAFGGYSPSGTHPAPSSADLLGLTDLLDDEDGDEQPSQLPTTAPPPQSPGSPSGSYGGSLGGFPWDPDFGSSFDVEF